VTQQVAALAATYGVKMVAKCGVLREQSTMARRDVSWLKILSYRALALEGIV
jgi:hypothetical protein